MKVLVYCQHVLGVGHFFRVLEICRALHRHRVFLVTGGMPVDARLPGHVTDIRLRPIRMDAAFSALLTDGEDIDSVKRQRRDKLFDVFASVAPDIFLVELYPFGRKAFRFELDPVLDAIHSGDLPPCRVVCSLRDILVEKRDADKYERRVVRTLNDRFDALLVHADPKMVRLEETFSRIADIEIPMTYTGFITPRPADTARERIRRELGLSDAHRLIVASAGGGRVGATLLEAVVDAVGRPHAGRRWRLVAFTGPYLDDIVFQRLLKKTGDGNRILRFSPDFLSFLAAADLSISMAGYNTSMNVLAAGVRAMVLPFAQNREQGMRARRLAAAGAVRVLEPPDLAPDRLVRLIDRMLAAPEPTIPDIDLDGARHTAAVLEQLTAPPVRHPG